jgi:hypothetical protein
MADKAAGPFSLAFPAAAGLGDGTYAAVLSDRPDDPAFGTVRAILWRCLHYHGNDEDARKCARDELGRLDRG